MYVALYENSDESETANLQQLVSLKAVDTTGNYSK